MHQSDVQVVVIGGGPAGLATAVEAARIVDSVVLVDAGPRLGGQFWRHSATDELPGAPAPRWHHGWSTFRELHDGVREAAAAKKLRALSSTHVAAVDRLESGAFELHLAPTPEADLSAPSVSPLRSIYAQTVVLCPGAYDRQLPVPGWTLPGVMAAGGVQAFIKTQERSPGERVLLAGTGPFLLAAAASVIQAGAQVVAICESGDLTGWVPRGVAGVLVPGKGVEGAQYAALLARHRVPYLRKKVVSRILGEGQVSSVEISRADRRGAPVPGTERVLEDIDVVGLGWGFVPQSELLVQTGAETRLDVDGSLVGVVDAEQESTVPGLFLAGEITGVTGAVGAVAEGRLAGAAAAARIIGRSSEMSRWGRSARARHRLFAQAMHHAHPAPDGWNDGADESTIVCRCEEVTLGEITAARDSLQAEDPRSLKGITRAGMGMCQGRICGAAMMCLGGSGNAPLAAARGVSKRPLALPVTVGQLAESDNPTPRCSNALTPQGSDTATP